MTTSRMRRAIAALALVAVAGVTVAACSDNDSSDASAREMSEDPATSPTVTDDNRQSDMADEPATNTIVDIAASNPDFSTLVAAVQAAGLAETLSGPGPFTVFAPTNEAFAKLPAGTVESLLDPANKMENTFVIQEGLWARDALAAASSATGIPVEELQAAAADPQALGLRTLVNGEIRQNNSTAKMIWSVAEIIAFFSHFYTLCPGVVIETGTPGGTAWATDPEIGGKPYERDDVVRSGYLQVGDVVTVEVDGVGTLTNPIVQA